MFFPTSEPKMSTSPWPPAGYPPARWALLHPPADPPGSAPVADRCCTCCGCSADVKDRGKTHRNTMGHSMVMEKRWELRYGSIHIWPRKR